MDSLPGLHINTNKNYKFHWKNNKYDIMHINNMDHIDCTRKRVLKYQSLDYSTAYGQRDWIIEQEVQCVN